MAEEYSTPTTTASPVAIQDASLDVLAQEEMDGMSTRLTSLVEVGAIPDKTAELFLGALPGFPADGEALSCSVSLGLIAD